MLVCKDFYLAGKDDCFPLYTCQVGTKLIYPNKGDSSVGTFQPNGSSNGNDISITHRNSSRLLGRPAYCASYCNEDRDHTT